ncbi:MAG: hypothetical protein P0Y65_05100 [Candidatus Devosia phytovorans]|uniref:Uncharacterized protein n=1 Tax=Candidatus Devosia phytovorans TaxID=3121372 RepID=A0AAJ6B1R2_9HYPH|nr:hypothetical protein [Devosia sp.]WEK05634.1 MAG: hypothetical protein P0Y65_05100 [Devosia sp.]
MKHFAGRLFLAATLLVQPALAQTTDELTSAIAAVPLTSERSAVLLYVSAAPPGFIGHAEVMQSMVEQNLINALALKQDDPISGIDFSQVTGILSFGHLADRVTVLFGAPGFAGSAPNTLQRREFEKRDIAGWTVFGLREDGHVRLAVDDPDPFSAPLGRAQRLAISDTTVVHTSSWPRMEAVLSAMATPPDEPSLWSATLEGTLRVLQGKAPASIMGAQNVSLAQPASTPKSPVSMLTLAPGATGTTTIVASPYDDAAAAEQNATALTQHHGSSLMPGATASIAVEEVAPHSIGMVTIVEPAAQ